MDAVPRLRWYAAWDGAMTPPDTLRADDPAHKHTIGARRAVRMGNIGGLIRHVIGWLFAISGEREH